MKLSPAIWVEGCQEERYRIGLMNYIRPKQKRQGDSHGKVHFCLSQAPMGLGLKRGRYRVNMHTADERRCRTLEAEYVSAIFGRSRGKPRCSAQCSQIPDNSAPDQIPKRERARYRPPLQARRERIFCGEFRRELSSKLSCQLSSVTAPDLISSRLHLPKRPPNPI